MIFFKSSWPLPSSTFAGIGAESMQLGN